MQRLASKFVKDQNLRQETVEFVPTTEPSYSKLRSSIRAGDERGAIALLAELRQHHTDSQIYHAMRVWASAPLTGSRRNERMFISSLTPQQKQVYSHAMEERLNILQGYVSVYVSEGARR